MAHAAAIRSRDGWPSADPSRCTGGYLGLVVDAIGGLVEHQFPCWTGIPVHHAPADTSVM
jgi:hypothetical protein